MASQLSDRAKLQSQKHFLDELEMGIQVANHEIIVARIPELSRERIHAFAVTVARLRADYLEAAFELGGKSPGDRPDPAMVEDLRSRRQSFEEARNAFEALRRAIQRGYIDIAGVDE